MNLEEILVELQHEHWSMTNYAQTFVSYCLKNKMCKKKKCRFASI